MDANSDPVFVFTEGVAPRRCFRCEGSLNACPCITHWDHLECDNCQCSPYTPEPLAEIVTVSGNHALVHQECLDDPSILA